MSNFTDRDYLYVSAVLRARQGAMLTQERLEQMLASGGVNEAARQLNECGWEDMTGMNDEEINASLAARRSAMFSELEKLVPEKAVVRVFRLKYDYHNAKAIVKGEGASVAVDGLLSKAGSVERERLERAFRENDFRFIPGELGKAMNEAKSLLARTGNPQLADFVLDKAYFAELTALSAEVSDPYLKSYVTLLIDCANLRSCVRCLRMGKDAEFLRSALIAGGTVGESRILQGVFSGEGVNGLYAPTALKEAAAIGAEAAQGGTLTVFERECDNTVNRFLRGARMTGFGSPLVVGYIAAEENNITAVRMVLTGLKAGIAPERLKERLRECYV